MSYRGLLELPIWEKNARGKREEQNMLSHLDRAGSTVHRCKQKDERTESFRA